VEKIKRLILMVFLKKTEDPQVFLGIQETIPIKKKKGPWKFHLAIFKQICPKTY